MNKQPKQFKSFTERLLALAAANLEDKDFFAHLGNAFADRLGAEAWVLAKVDQRGCHRVLATKSTDSNFKWFDDDDTLKKAIAEACRTNRPVGLEVLKRGAVASSPETVSSAQVSTESPAVSFENSESASGVKPPEVVFKNPRSSGEAPEEPAALTGYWYLTVATSDTRDLAFGFLVPQKEKASGPTLLTALESIPISCNFRTSIANEKTWHDAHESSKAEVERVRQSVAVSSRALTLGNRISVDLEKERAGFLLANEIKSFLDVERVTILDVVGETTKVTAVSGVPTFDKRSNLIRATQKLGNIYADVKEAVWFTDGNTEMFPDSTRQHVDAYLEESLVKGFGIIPMIQSEPPAYSSESETLVEIVNEGRTHTKTTSGLILLESITSALDVDRITKDWPHVEELVTNHVVNSKRYSDLFFLKPMKMAGRFLALYRGHTKRLAVAITSAIVAVLLLGSLIPTDFLVRCEGYLVASDTCRIYVQEPGVVDEILVNEGDRVRAGQALMRLSNPSLQQELVKLKGDLARKKSELKTVLFNRSRSTEAGQSEGDYDALVQKSAILEKGISYDEEEIAILMRQLKRHTITSPIDGDVIGWKLDRRFLNRPLEPGTLLFSVANQQGEKQLELKIPNLRAGYVEKAVENADGEHLEVLFALASSPQDTWEAKLIRTNEGLEEDSDLGYVLKAFAMPTESLGGKQKNGMPLVAKINCGRRSFFYCKLYEFRDWCNRALFEYVY